ncbi:MAG: hypothetical protein Q9207_003244 [Kuettlingeria erythrocarpa]
MRSLNTLLSLAAVITALVGANPVYNGKELLRLGKGLARRQEEEEEDFEPYAATDPLRKGVTEGSTSIPLENWNSASKACFTEGKNYAPQTTVASAFSNPFNLQGVPERFNGFKQQVFTGRLKDQDGNPSDRRYPSDFGFALQKFLTENEQGFYGAADDVGKALADQNVGNYTAIKDYFTAYVRDEYKDVVSFLSTWMGTSYKSTPTATSSAAASKTSSPDSDPAPTSSTISAPIIVLPVDPPSQPSCVPNPTDSVKDSHEDELQKAAAFFCSKHTTSPTISSGLISIADMIIAGDREKSEGFLGITIVVNEAYEYPPDLGNQDDVYDISITSVDNCTPNGGFDLATPVPNHQCADILYSAWKDCANQGRGGQITAGCLVYSIETKY